VNPDAKYAMRVDITNVGEIMMIKTTQDDNISAEYFMGFSDTNDTQKDYEITKLYYKIWTVNAGQKMLNSVYSKKGEMTK